MKRHQRKNKIIILSRCFMEGWAGEIRKEPRRSEKL